MLLNYGCTSTLQQKRPGTWKTDLKKGREQQVYTVLHHQSPSSTRMDVSIRFSSSDLASLDKVHRWRPRPPAASVKVSSKQSWTRTHTNTHLSTTFLRRVFGGALTPKNANGFSCSPFSEPCSWIYFLRRPVDGGTVRVLGKILFCGSLLNGTLTELHRPISRFFMSTPSPPDFEETNTLGGEEPFLKQSRTFEVYISFLFYARAKLVFGCDFLLKWCHQLVR